MVCEQVQNDVVDDVSTGNTCRSSDTGRHMEGDAAAAAADPVSKVFQLAVRGLFVIGRLLLAVVNAVLRLCTSRSATADAGSTSRSLSRAQAQLVD